MSLSGGDEKDTQEKLTSEIFQNYGHLTESIYACSDTQCAMYTATDKGKFCQNIFAYESEICVSVYWSILFYLNVVFF